MQEADPGTGGLGGRRERHTGVTAEGEFAFQVRIGALPLTIAERITGLGHEPVDHPVPGHIVVEPTPRQQLDPFDMQRGHLRCQFHQDSATRGVDNQQILGRNGTPLGHNNRRCGSGRRRRRSTDILGR